MTAIIIIFALMLAAPFLCLLALMAISYGLWRGEPRSPVQQSHEHVDPLDLIPAQPNWLEQVARNAGV